MRQRNEREADYRYRGDEIYDTLVEELFRRYHPRADRLEICFATRGNKARTHAFRAAIAKAEARFESQHGMRRSAEVAIIASTPPQKAGLQAVDCFLWALQRRWRASFEAGASFVSIASIMSRRFAPSRFLLRFLSEDSPKFLANPVAPPVKLCCLCVVGLDERFV